MVTPYDGTMTTRDPNLIDTLTLPDDVPATVRAYVVYDTDAACPDWDGIGYVCTIGDQSARWDAMPITGDGSESAPAIGADEIRAAWDHYRDWQLVARYLAIWHDVVSVDTLSRDDSTVIAVVTRSHAESWGCPRDAWASLATQAINAYRQWADGEVYGVIVTDSETGAQASLWGVYDDTGAWTYARDVAAELVSELAYDFRVSS